MSIPPNNNNNNRKRTVQELLESIKQQEAVIGSIVNQARLMNEMDQIVAASEEREAKRIRRTQQSEPWTYVYLGFVLCIAMLVTRSHQQGPKSV
jgi:hypothetical protein